MEALCWPVMQRLLNTPPGSRVLDIACGNGCTSRRVAELGYEVTAFDFSERMIENAIERSQSKFEKLQYHMVEGTDEKALLELGIDKFEGAFSNMALFTWLNLIPCFER